MKQYYLALFEIVLCISYYNVQSTNLVGSNVAGQKNNTSDPIGAARSNTTSPSGYVPIFLSDSISNVTLRINSNQTSVAVKKQVPLVNSVTPMTTKSTPETTEQSYSVLELVRNLDIRLKNMRNVELGVTIIQEIFDAMDFTTVIQNDNETVGKLAKRMSKKIENAIDTVDQLSTFILTNISVKTGSSDHIFLNTVIQPYPFDDFTLEQSYNKKQIQILNYLKINGYHHEDDLNFTANAQIVEEIRRLNTDESHFKHIFFLSRDDHASDHSRQNYFNDINFRHLYVSAIQRKHVFLLIDHGKSFNMEQLELSKTFASYMINLLSDTDTISIVALSDYAYAVELEGDENFRYNASMDNKEQILKFIEGLNRSKEVTNHTLGFKYSFEILQKQNISEEIPVQFVYITRGLMSTLTEATSVLVAIAKGQKMLKEPIAIDTCAVILDEKRIMYEKQFLHDIAQQNYTKYDINVSDWLNRQRHSIKGNMYIVTKRNLELIIKTSTMVFERLFQQKYLANNLVYHQPVLDYQTKDVIVSVTRSVQHYGVAGVNLYLSDLAEDIIYYKKSENSYAFLVNINGITIFHPAFPRPIATTNMSFPVDIAFLEKTSNFSVVRSRILSEIIGNHNIEESVNQTITYTWHRVLDAYVICIVSVIKTNGKVPVYLSKVTPGLRYYQHIDSFSQEILYHRIDLIPPQTPVCRHFRQIATLDTGTVFLSASSFQSPFIFMRNNREHKEHKDDIHTNNAQSIMAYIKDITNLLANPGLQPQIRNDVAALYQVMSYLKKRHQEAGLLKKYIIRRYVATTNGVLHVYPGCILGSDLEPSRRPWFRKAMKHSGRIILTEPYLDAGGAGFIITIAHTIFEGKANALHNAERDLPIAIVAIDVPYAFLNRLILDSSAFCSETNIKCILMEDQGYLLAHPTFLEPSTPTKNNRRPLEHITHKESFVANDILNHKRLVRKNACANYQNRIVQRYYHFNTSLREVLTNVVHGERTKYQITAIRGTNIFAVVLNSTCDGGAFCPCSTVDRVCLNCNRMDQTDCECPCECPLRLENSTHLEYCEPPTECFAVVNSLSYDWNMGLKSCVNINCDLYSTQNECLGVMGCEWCQLDVDSNPFPTPFCISQSSCFNGVLGSQTPYGDGDLGPAIIEPSIPPAYSAIGPVGGAIIALCLVVGFAMYCYRQNLESGSEQLYADSMQDDNYGVPLSRFNFDDISPHDDSDLSGTGSNVMHRNLLHPLANVIAVNDISPYHMSTGGYRRPNGESDHGYSTMTPHEDSEHMCFTLVEPLINNKRLSMSDSMSINTSVSSPTNHSQLIAIDKPPVKQIAGYPSPGQTVLPEQVSPHHILAPVTVHRHMEAS